MNLQYLNSRPNKYSNGPLRFVRKKNAMQKNYWLESIYSGFQGKTADVKYV